MATHWFRGLCAVISRRKRFPWRPAVALQRLGESLVNEKPKEFCRAVLDQAKWEPGKGVVVDGIRHAAIVNVLREIAAPAELLLVYVAAPDSLREARVQRREGLDVPLDLLDSHSTESEVETLHWKMANLIVDGNRPTRELACEITVWVKGHSE